jgi:hypothetical protein
MISDKWILPLSIKYAFSGIKQRIGEQWVSLVGVVMYGVRCAVRGAWCVVCGAWCAVRGARCLADVLRKMRGGVWNACVCGVAYGVLYLEALLKSHKHLSCKRNAP